MSYFLPATSLFFLLVFKRKLKPEFGMLIFKASQKFLPGRLDHLNLNYSFHSYLAFCQTKLNLFDLDYIPSSMKGMSACLP